MKIAILVLLAAFLTGCDEYRDDLGDTDAGAQPDPDNYYNPCARTCRSLDPLVCFYPQGNECGYYGRCDGAGGCRESEGK